MADVLASYPRISMLHAPSVHVFFGPSQAYTQTRSNDSRCRTPDEAPHEGGSPTLWLREMDSCAFLKIDASPRGEDELAEVWQCMFLFGT